MLGEQRGCNLCQECFICIQGDYKDFGVKGMKNLTFYQNLDFVQSLPTIPFAIRCSCVPR
jgi:hypothetical protein